MLYMVCRRDAVDRTITNSHMWPAIVEAPANIPAENVLLDYMENRYPGYVGKHQYYVIPIHDDSSIVSFKPKRDWDVSVRNLVPQHDC